MLFKTLLWNTILKRIESSWRHWIVYPVLRGIYRNTEVTTPIDVNSVSKVLILRYDRIGDMIVTTAIVNELKEMYPHLSLGVLASPLNEEIVRYNMSLDRIHVLSRSWWRTAKTMLEIRKEKYDVVLNLVFNRTTSGGILSNIVAPKAIKIGQGDKKYKFFFNVLLTLDRSHAHMLETIQSIFEKVFHISFSSEKLKYRIYIDEESQKKVNEYCSANGLRKREEINQNKTPYLIMNLSAHDTVRGMSVLQVNALGEYLSSKKQWQTVLLHAPNDKVMSEARNNLVESTNCLAFPERGKASLLELAAIIKGADAVITPDTSIVHFASAMGTPIFGLYTPLQDVHEWLPYKVSYKTLLSEIGKPTETIPISRIIDELEIFLNAQKKGRTEPE